MLLLVTSFAAGILTVLAPCILPLLPVIVGGSFTGDSINKKKASTIIISLGVSVLLFTLLLKVSTLFIDIPPSTWTYVSGGIVLLLGLVTLFPSLWENKFLNTLSLKSNQLMNVGDQKNNFWGDIIVGASLGPVFSTCSPTYFIVLATVLPVNPVTGILYILAYIFGLCISLLLITILGQKIISKLDIAVDAKSWFKKILGVIFILVGLAILTGLDKKLQADILSAGFFDVTRLEHVLLEQGNGGNSDVKGVIAPELSTIDGYINTDGKPITLADLRGKVVLLDIWTYSCINCQRTLPYLNEWYEKYKDQGFIIVGLHTPEFGFEKVQANVEKAVEKFNIEYPVVLDNDYSTWNALGNQYWPRKYLIDQNGVIIYDHIGEGGYEETEKKIQEALKISRPVSTLKPISIDTKSPETYFGSLRNQYLANGQAQVSGVQKLTVPIGDLLRNRLYLGGTWNITSEYSENETAGEIVFSYDAKNMYITAGSFVGVEVEVYQDDVFVKKIMITDEQLYTLVENGEAGKHVMKIKIPKKGLKAFTFTFG